MKYLLHLFNTPSDFGDDWKAYARNVLLHIFLVGAISAASDGIVPGWGFAFGCAVYACWEAAQWLWRNALAWDCVEDWAFVQIGALAYLTSDPRVIVVAAAFLVSGVLRRMPNARSD